jgi:hypothetical protein
VRRSKKISLYEEVIEEVVILWHDAWKPE